MGWSRRIRPNMIGAKDSPTATQQREPGLSRSLGPLELVKRLPGEAFVTSNYSEAGRPTPRRCRTLPPDHRGPSGCPVHRRCSARSAICRKHEGLP
jgi:hypothetical protein